MGYTAADIRARQFLLRMLLVSPPKWGKTTAAVGTCPKPCLVLNTDGQGALDYVVLAGKVQDDELQVEDIASSRDYKDALATAKAGQKIKGSDKRRPWATVILDNLTFLAEQVEGEVLKELKDGRQAYPEITRQLMSIIRELCKLSSHVIIIGHVEPSEENKAAGSFGHILSISGKSKTKIPSAMQDWVWLQVTYDEETKQSKYEFLLAPDGHWKQAVRSIKTDAKRMEADVSKFIRLASKRAGANASTQTQHKSVK